eukprot:gene3238-5681_t
MDLQLLHEDLLGEIFSFLEDDTKVHVLNFVSKQFKNISRNQTKEIILSDDSKEKLNDFQLENVLNIFTRLKTLDLCFCENLISPKIKSNFLKILYLNSTQISGDSIKFILKNNPNLIELNLSCVESINEIEIEHENIEILYLEEGKVSENSFNHIISHFPRLKCIQLSGAYNINSYKFKSKTLKELYLQHTDLNDECLKRIIENCPNLSILNLNGCLALKNFDVFNHQILKELDLSGTRITFFMLSSTNLPKLETLNFKSCAYFNNIYIENHENIKKINLTKTDINEESIEIIQKNYPNLNLINNGNRHHYQKFGM